MKRELIKCQCETGQERCARDATAEDFRCDVCRDRCVRVTMKGVEVGSHVEIVSEWPSFGLPA